MFQPLDASGQPLPFHTSKVVCVGRNYLDHIRELNNPVPEQALLFIKPSTACCRLDQPLLIPTGQGECHNELELAVVISKPLIQATEQQALSAIWGYGLGLDLTLRQVQSELKAKGMPWERAKAFDGSCPLSGFVPAAQVTDPQCLDFRLTVNNQTRQQGNTALMMRSVVQLIAEISQSFSLLPGDIVMTGTPSGVGPLYSGDQLEAELVSLIQLKTKVI